MPNVYILIGNIGSGKTYWARRKVFKGAIYISNDAITDMMHMGDYTRYDPELSSTYHRIEDTLLEDSLLNQDRDIIIDRTNMSRAKRKRFICLINCYINVREGKSNIEWKKIAVVFNSDIITCLHRRSKNSKGITERKWAEIYNKFADEFESPTLDEGFDDIIEAPKNGAYKIHAFDFDGTICKNEYPEIGKIRNSVVDKMKKLWEDDLTRIIIWTCREGEDERRMAEWLYKNNVPYDYINYDSVWTGGIRCRKLFAHYYYDDRNALVGD